MNAQSEAETILVFGQTDEEIEVGDRSIRDLGRSASEILYGRGNVALEKVAGDIDAAVSKVRNLLASIRSDFDEFQLEEIEFSLDISAGGKVSLLGCGTEGKATGGLSFKLVRK